MEPDGTEYALLGDHAEIRVSNVDKKSASSELPVRLCNYMDAYSNDYVNGAMPFMRATASGTEIGRFGLQPNDVIITKDSETPDDIGIAATIEDTGGSPPLVCGYHLAILRSRAINPVFFAKQLGHPRVKAYFARVATGTTRYGLSNAAVARVPLFLPPRSEQDQVAVVLRTVDDAILKTEQIIAKLNQVKQGLLHDLLTRGIDENGELRDPERHPEKFKASVLGRIPREWRVGGVADLVVEHAGMKPGPFGSALTKDSFVSAGYKVYGQEQVLADSLEYGDYFITETKYNELQAFAVAENDLLMTMVGAGTIGKVLTVRSPFQPGVINPRLMRIRLQPDVADVPFVRELIHAPLVRRQFERFRGGGTMPVLNLKVLRAVRVPIMTIGEQREIAARLHATRQREACELRELAKLRLLKSALMDDLLTGRVRTTALLAPPAPWAFAALCAP